MSVRYLRVWEGYQAGSSVSLVSFRALGWTHRGLASSGWGWGRSEPPLIRFGWEDGGGGRAYMGGRCLFWVFPVPTRSHLFAQPLPLCPFVCHMHLHLPCWFIELRPSKNHLFVVTNQKVRHSLEAAGWRQESERSVSHMHCFLVLRGLSPTLGKVMANATLTTTKRYLPRTRCKGKMLDVERAAVCTYVQALRKQEISAQVNKGGQTMRKTVAWQLLLCEAETTHCPQHWPSQGLLCPS